MDRCLAGDTKLQLSFVVSAHCMGSHRISKEWMSRSRTFLPRAQTRGYRKQLYLLHLIAVRWKLYGRPNSPVCCTSLWELWRGRAQGCPPFTAGRFHLPGARNLWCRGETVLGEWSLSRTARVRSAEASWSYRPCLAPEGTRPVSISDLSPLLLLQCHTWEDTKQEISFQQENFSSLNKLVKSEEQTFEQDCWRENSNEADRMFGGTCWKTRTNRGRLPSIPGHI